MRLNAGVVDAFSSACYPIAHRPDCLATASTGSAIFSKTTQSVSIHFRGLRHVEIREALELCALPSKCIQGLCGSAGPVPATSFSTRNPPPSSTDCRPRRSKHVLDVPLPNSSAVFH